MTISDPGHLIATRYGLRDGARIVIRPDGYIGHLADLTATPAPCGPVPGRHAPGGRRAGQGHRDVMVRALQRPQVHFAGVSGPGAVAGSGARLAVAGGRAGAGAPGEGPGNGLRPGRVPVGRNLTLKAPRPCGNVPVLTGPDRHTFT